MQFSRKSFSNLAALESGEDSMAELQGSVSLVVLASFLGEELEGLLALLLLILRWWWW